MGPHLAFPSCHESRMLRAVTVSLHLRWSVIFFSSRNLPVSCVCFSILNSDKHTTMLLVFTAPIFLLDVIWLSWSFLTTYIYWQSTNPGLSSFFFHNSTLAYSSDRSPLQSPLRWCLLKYLFSSSSFFFLDICHFLCPHHNNQSILPTSPASCNRYEWSQRTK